MGGGLIQLVSVGFEDLYLTNDPQVTFFKIVYKRHTNFSQELIPQLYNSIPDFGKRVTCRLSKNGDLINRMYIYLELPNIPVFYDNTTDTPNQIKKLAWIKKIGYGIIKSVELEIGGQLIDKHYGDWFNIWEELTETCQRDTLNKLIGNVPDVYNFTNGKDTYKLFIPLKFWFCRNIGLSLPIIALYFNDIKIHVEFNELSKLIRKSATNYIEIDDNSVLFNEGDLITQTIDNVITTNIYSYYDFINKRLYYIKYKDSFVSGYNIYNSDGYYATPKTNATEAIFNITIPNLSIVRSNLLINYIYLDNDERKRFVKSNHEYLIDFIQFEGEKTIYNNHIKLKLGYNHPCKELIWVSQYVNIKNGNLNDLFNYTNSIENGESLIKRTKILLNGQVRVTDKNFFFYNYLQPIKTHTNSPSNGINIYPFCINPEDSQPSGSCNFSKMDDIVLEFSVSKDVDYNHPAIVRVYNNAYNVFRIIDGLSGLAFSN